ncbi:MAG: glycosyltransferase [Lachnospiraceae bacterium]|nr:glycosyltransferase [Lachnospiraceae bacterium]
MERVSVVMSCYNEKEIHLREAIESILNQDFRDFEFIIVIDNPENTVIHETIKEYAQIDSRIVLIRNDKNIGLAESLNKGIRIAKGKYIARMDADDISLPSRLKTQVEYMDANSKYNLVCANFIKIDDQGNKLEVNKSVPKNDSLFVRSIKRRYIIAHPTVMMRREPLCDIGIYNNYSAAQDYDLWLRMVKNGFSMHYIKEPLIKYRFREGSIGSSKRNIQFLSCRYAKNIYKQNKAFDEEKYNEFLSEKKADKRYIRGVEYYYEGMKQRKIGSLLKSSFLNSDCRKEIIDNMIGKIYVEKLR